MHWVHAHPYAAASALVGFLILMGGIFVERRTSAEPGNLTVWGGNGAPLLNPSSYTPSELKNDLQLSNGSNVAPTYIPPAKGSTVSTSPEDSFEIGELLARISQPATSSPASVQTSSTSSTGASYSFLPRGLITITAQKERTEDEQRLFQYGNDVGSYIQTYEEAYANAPTMLRDQAEDRQNTAKAQSVKQVGAALRNVGENLRGMGEVPLAVKDLHLALAESYIAAGNLLAKVPDARPDDSFIAAIEAYNAAADTLVRNYVQLSVFFSLSGVGFREGDPGSIFMFSGTTAAL